MNNPGSGSVTADLIVMESGRYAGRMQQRYIVRLTEFERTELERLIAVGQAPARKLMHARIRETPIRRGDGPEWA